MENGLGVRIDPETIVAVMLESSDNWNKIRDFCKTIISKKEEEERRRQTILV